MSEKTRDPAVEVRCACGARLKAPAHTAGRSVRCPRCRNTLTVPAAARSQPGAAPGAKITARCSCGAKLVAPARSAGLRARCPKCGQEFAFPSIPPGNAAKPPADPAADFVLEQLGAGEAVAIGPVPTIGGVAPSAPPPELALRVAPAPARVRPAPLEEEARPREPARTCPACSRQWPAGTVICVDCGINLTTGRPLLMTDDEKLDQIYMYAERAIRWISWLIPWGVYPIASEAFGMRKPWVARGVAVLTILVSAWFMAVFIYNPDPGDPGLVNLMLWSGEPLDLRAELRQEGVSEADIEEYLRDAPPLGEFQPRQLFTHALLHDGVLHLAGNLLFLMVFGTRVKALIGNILTALVYPLLAVIAGVFHMVSNAHAPAAPMLGASGAIMGLAGMYFVLAPVHQVHVAAWWRWGLVRGFQLSLKLFTRRGFWVVLFYIAFDVAFTIWRIDDDVAHWAHLGGFLGGAALATLLLSARLVNARGGDVFTAVFGRHAWVLIGRPNRPGLTLP